MFKSVLGVVAAVALIAGGVAVAQDMGGGDKKDQEMPVAKPTKEHEVLKHYAGTWTVKGKFTMPDGSTMEEDGVETASLVGDGLWLVFDNKSRMMGKPFHGHGVMGYDPEKKKYVGTWVDSMIDYLIVFEGTGDGKTITTHYEMKDCMNPGKTMRIKQVHEIQDADHHKMTAYFPSPDGKEFPGMVLEYTRKK